MTRFIVLISIIHFSLSAFSQTDRNVIWLHGLEEKGQKSSHSFWHDYAIQFANQRRINSNNLDFDSSLGVRNMAQQVVNRTGGNANSIGIGHSMGGVVWREIDKNTDPNHVGGIITIGAPLNGARIINAWQNGEVNAYINNGVDELIKGPKREFFAEYVIVNTAFRAFDGRSLSELIKEIAMDSLPMELLEGQSPQDLKEGSSYMNSARQYYSQTPKISIYGSENSPVHYRLASSSIGKPDTHFPDVINKAVAVYSAMYIKNAAKAFSPIALWRASGWKAGRDYLKEKSEKGWNSLIGATRTETRQSCYDVFVCQDYSCYNNIQTYEDYLRCQEMCYQEQCRTITQHYNQPSDGLLHQSTQTGQRTNATTSQWWPDATFEALGANHNEYDDHPETERHLNTIFDARAGAPGVFRTLLR